jgi:hypothetical protein
MHGVPEEAPATSIDGACDEAAESTSSAIPHPRVSCETTTRVNPIHPADRADSSTRSV